MKKLFVALMIVLGLSSASFDVLAQTCSPPPTCAANQASRWNGTGWSCVQAFGGQYQTTYFAPITCRYANPLTGSCSCPAGFTAHQSGEFMNNACLGVFYGVPGQTSGCGYIQYTCY